MHQNRLAVNTRRDFFKVTLGMSAILSIYSKGLFALTKCEDPLIQEDNLIFLFQGDSITHGGRGMDPNDLNHVMGHGFASIIAGRIGADFPEKHIVFYNRGLIGHKVTDLEARWQSDTLDLKPDVLTILIGINDSDSLRNDPKNGVSIEVYEKTYRNLLEQVKAQNPKVLFVLGEPFILPMEEEVNKRDVAARSAVVRKLAADYNAVFVPFQKVFNKALSRAPEKYWIWDHIHPTIAGHELMAREWLKCVGRRITFLTKGS